MKVLLVDADSKIPNLALMKLSTFYKNLGAEVTLLRIGLSYYSKKPPKEIYTSGYDKVYCSIIFQSNKNLIQGKNIIYGGTGYDYSITLPENIENIQPDYALYPDNDISYGFITRGCSRNCKFCTVPKKEGKLRQVSTIDEIVQHKKVKFLDNNFLAFKDHKKILKELRDKKVKCQFNQGLDIRLLDEENAKLLTELNYYQDYSFSFDNIKDKDILEKKFKLWKKYNYTKGQNTKIFLLCAFDRNEIYDDNFFVNDISNLFERISIIKKYNFKPYVMRYYKYNESKYRGIYINIAQWANQPSLFYHNSYMELCEKDNLRKGGKSATKRYNDLFIKDYPEISNKYFFK